LILALKTVIFQIRKLNLHFQHKEYLWLLIGAVVLVILFAGLKYWKKRVKKKIGDEKLVNVLIADYSPPKFLLKFCCIVLAFVLGTITVMNLRKPGSSESNNRKGIDIAIALDVSKSMLSTDLAPNRLERAKQFIGKMMHAMPDDRIALVLFAGKAYLQMPLTTDHGAAQLFVSSASPDAVPQQGTVITDALEMSTRVFDNTSRKFKAVVLLTDGEDHDVRAVSTAKELAVQGVMINTVGIGSAEGSVIIDPATGSEKRDDAGNIVISKLNEEVLREVAAKTNGVYIKLQSSDEAVAMLKGQLSQIERKAFGDMSMMNFTVYYYWFAGLMFVLLLVENFISEKKRIKAGTGK
jgi:Ca-activated chloride channel family protein